MRLLILAAALAFASPASADRFTIEPVLRGTPIPGRVLIEGKAATGAEASRRVTDVLRTLIEALALYDPAAVPSARAQMAKTVIGKRITGMGNTGAAQGPVWFYDIEYRPYSEHYTYVSVRVEPE